MDSERLRYMIVCCLCRWAFLTLDDVELDPLTVAERLETFSPKPLPLVEPGTNFRRQCLQWPAPSAAGSCRRPLSTERFIYR